MEEEFREKMEKEFVPYDLSLRLKELGFDEPCFGIFFPSDKSWKDLKFRNSQQDNIVASPLFSQAFRWFREKCGIWVTFEYDDCDCVEADICWYVGKCFKHGVGPLFLTNELGDFKTYDEAELACLKKLIEIIETKSQ
jgi:hypothetical protein